jgi:hypothetical protein
MQLASGLMSVFGAYRPGVHGPLIGYPGTLPEQADAAELLGLLFSETGATQQDIARLGRAIPQMTVLSADEGWFIARRGNALIAVSVG